MKKQKTIKETLGDLQFAPTVLIVVLLLCGITVYNVMQPETYTKEEIKEIVEGDIDTSTVYLDCATESCQMTWLKGDNATDDNYSWARKYGYTGEEY